MITLCIIAVILAAVFIAVGLILLIGGAALLPIVLDLAVAGFVIAFLVKILKKK